jgi:hypothetical protein
MFDTVWISDINLEYSIAHRILHWKPNAIKNFNIGKDLTIKFSVSSIMNI